MLTFRLTANTTLDNPDVEEVRSLDMLRGLPSSERITFLTRWDFKTFEIAEKVAASASKLGVQYIATDAGTHCSPRFDVVQAFKVGDKVSYSFNGDSYPDGEIVSIGKGRMARITTTTGKTYNRLRMSGMWKSADGGTWTLGRGHHYEQNPCF